MKFTYIFIAIFAVMFAALSPLSVQAEFILEPPHLEVPGFDEYDCNHCHNLTENPLLECIICHKPTRKAPFDLTDRCLNCHGPEPSIYPATLVGTHSSGTSGSERFSYYVECVHCHDPHRHLQNYYYGTTYGKYVEVIISADLEVTDFTVEPPLEFEKHASAIIRFTDETEFDDGDDYYTEDICNTCHTQTNHHQRDGTAPGGQGHFDGTDCTSCHLHRNGFGAPTGVSGGGACTACHGQEQGERRQIVGAGGDFGKMSHHVRGEVQDEDCMTCHYVVDHASQTVKLKDADQGDAQVYSYDPTDPAGLEAFCLSCHDEDGAVDGDGIQPFSDGYEVPDIEGGAGSIWEDSAHRQIGFLPNGGFPLTCLGDGTTTGCHRDGHGSDKEKMLSSEAGAIDEFCFNCHTEGMVRNDAISNNRPGDYVSADDIEEAFNKSRAHNLGSTVTVGGNTYTLQCTTCHNPHVVTGRYWEAEIGKSPVTRPDLTADPSTNPRAMGASLWGAAAGEKMDDFAARSSGSGGWYFSTARGGGIAIDQPAVYQPPKSGGGTSFEFAGDVLPDYTTLCLDCHSQRVNDSIPPVNWGQGIGCTDTSVDPPDQRIECGADHGLGMAGKPMYVTDEGTAGFWGSSGNPDMIFQMNYVTRGRHNGHFMRWPYDSAERGAGINFVMACTDCHEAHGSNRGGMIRERLNVNANGDCGTGSTPEADGENCSDGGLWNSFCNVCHYYYAGQHAGMSCGTASCHEANSIHRIVHTVDSGAGTQLMLTAAGYESYFERPEFTPEIEAATGHIGSDELTVTFRPSQGTIGIYTNEDLTGGLNTKDLWLFDANGDNPKTITGVIHTAGSYTATLTLSAPLSAADLDSDTLAVRPRTVWDWYEGGYENWATGTIEAQVASAGPWPVAISGPPPVSILKSLYGGDEIYLFFSEAVYGSGAGGAIDVSDLVLSGCGGRTIIDVSHTAGEAVAVVMLDAPLGLEDLGVCSVAAVAGTIQDDYGNFMGTESVALSLSDECPPGDVSIELNEEAASPYVFGDQSLLVGRVNNPGMSLQGDGYFHGDEDEATYIDLDSNDTCLKEADTLTLEARIFPYAVDLDFYDGDGDGIDDDDDPDEPDLRNSTQHRVFERKRAIQFTIMRGNWCGDGVVERAGKARVKVKCFVDTESRHDCPHPQWPDDTYEGADARWHELSSDIDLYPIVADHWYRIRVVFNSDKSGIPGSNGTPLDIFADDQGTDGLDTDQLWDGFINIAMPESLGCKYGVLPGDFLTTEDQPSCIGDNLNHTDIPGDQSNQLFKGLIDWVTWKAEADYSGVDDLPH